MAGSVDDDGSHRNQLGEAPRESSTPFSEWMEQCPAPTLERVEPLVGLFDTKLDAEGGVDFSFHLVAKPISALGQFWWKQESHFPTQAPQRPEAPSFHVGKVWRRGMDIFTIAQFAKTIDWCAIGKKSPNRSTDKNLAAKLNVDNATSYRFVHQSKARTILDGLLLSQNIFRSLQC